ncbi:MFS transporter [Thalassomonas sp. M1454]|uniref:MFS transporter n=1 Tax=Thalassomonas sp. M1454 TaxID=2594477 RepID=UPI001180B758|nr:MFS transporter [Thalassomonas sp. M1454]TRX58064.1 SLC45 family MFS transporter [Thalassomonas sp. M1454]
MKQKPQLSFWQIWNMCFGFIGIQFGFALQNANVSRIFQTLGAEIDDIPILWIAAPLTGLIVQPIVGYFSDKTWNSFGRRRPFFFAGAILTTLALFVMPNSPTLWIAAGALWILDASINITMEPFRAFVGDNLPHEQRTSGFAMQSFFIGIGAIVASAMPYMLANWFGISNVAPAGEIADSVKYSFYFGGVVLFASVMWTVYRSKEYSPEQLAEFEAAEELHSQGEAQAVTRTKINFKIKAISYLTLGVFTTVAIHQLALDKQLYILSLGAIAFAVIQFAADYMQAANKTSNGFYEVIDDLYHMPETMRKLAITQFFSWFGLFAMWIYTTSAVTSYHFGSTDTSSAAYNAGADWVGVLFAAYNGFAALAAFLIPVLASRYSRQIAHFICLSCGAAGLISMVFIENPDFLLFSMVGVGIAWASILSVPYSLLSSSLPAKKMGVYMGIFNFFIVIPQLLAASALGLLVRELFAGQSLYALVLGGVLMFIAGLTVLRVKD